MTPPDAALLKFAQDCKAFYIDGNTSRSPEIVRDEHYELFIKIQNAVRGLSHRQRAFTGNITLSKLLSAPIDNCDPSHRQRELGNFIEFWRNQVGVQPFLKGLWAVFHLQSHHAGRLTWEVDDATFLESAYVLIGPVDDSEGFDSAAVNLMRAVFGFQVTEKRDPANGPIMDITIPHNQAFLRISLDNNSAAWSAANEQAPLLPPSCTYMRRWIFPASIANNEVYSLARLFPKSVRANDKCLHQAGFPVTFGTGEIWESDMLRDEGWRGSRWFRFMQWVRWIFGIM